MGKTGVHNNLSNHTALPSAYVMPFTGPQKRVWIKRMNGCPTSIMTSRFDVVDDLKAAVFRKYPNTIAKLYDLSEVCIFVTAHGRDQVHQSNITNNNVLISRTIGEISDDSVETLLALLEPDKIVWEALDEYFGSEMKMSDAFLIDARREQSQDSSNLLHLNVQEINVKEVEKGRSLSPVLSNLQKPATSNLRAPKPHNPKQFSSVLATRKHSPESPKVLAEASPIGLIHKHTQSSSSQSPLSLALQSKINNCQAVLLLPRNFSLSDHHSLKRISIDENRIDRIVLKQKSHLPIIGKRSSGTRSSLETVRPPTTDQESAAEIFSDSVTNASRPKIDRGTYQTILDGNNDALTQGNDKKTKNPMRDTTEKTLNTSTFEQVLPSISVLVVEDNSINQTILGAFLRKHKIHYLIAKNGQEAVDKWRKGGFHLVLMDIQLPVKSGIEATKEIRFLEKVNRIGVFAQHELTNSHATEHLRIKEDQKLDLNIFRSPVIIVALTASSNSSIDKKNALTAGCNDFLTKPVNLVWLQNKITEWGCMQALIDFDGWRCKGHIMISPSSQSASSA